MSNVRRYKGKVHPQVEVARESYQIPHFNGHRSVFSYENSLQKMGSLDNNDRLTCPDCARFKTDHDWKACDLQGKLF
jgi:hypothetical protein